MAFKCIKDIIREYLNQQDRDILYGSRADAILAGVKAHRLELLRELSKAEDFDDRALTKALAPSSTPGDSGLLTFVTARDFVVTLRVLAALAAND